MRFSVRYDNRLTDPQEFQNSFQHPQRDNDAAGSPTAAAAAAAASQKYTFSRAASAPSFSTDSTAAEEIEEAATGRYVDPRVDERNRKLKRFAESQCVTHVVLSVTPVATSAEEVIPPAVLSFDLESMSVLLKDAAPSSVDEFLADAKKASLAQLAKRLASLVRLEYTNSGIKYAVVGVFSEPAHISCGWPVDQVNLNDDDSDIDDDLGPPLSPSILEEEPGRSPEAAVEICSASPSPSPPPPPPGMEEEPKDPQEEVAAEVLIVSVSSDEPPAEEPPPQCSDPPMLCGYCTCPLHPELSASTPCACLRREVTIKGSSLWVYGDFQPPLDSAMDLQAAALLAESSSLCDVYALLRKGVSVQCANSLTVLAVDQADESLSCEVSVTAAQLCCLLQRAALASSLSRAADVKNLSKHNQQQVPVDLRNHPALVDELFSVICSEAHMDLFLSRKSRVMKLSVK